MVAGHRRKMAAELAQLPEIPCIVRNLTDDEATIIMVDSNLQREQILPSEMVFRKDLRLLKIPAKTLHLAEAGEMIQEKRIQEEQDAGQIREMEQKRLLNSKVQRYGFLER